MTTLSKLKEVINRPGSEEITLARLGELALATLDHLNDAGDDDGDYYIDIKTQMNPDQLQQVIDLLGTLPADHPERRKINVLEFHLRNTQEDMRDSIQDIKNCWNHTEWHTDTLYQIQNDYDVAFAVLQQNPEVFDHVGPKFQADRDMALLSVQWDGGFHNLSPEFRADFEITLEAVTWNSSALRSARGRLRGNPQVVLRAVERDGRALQYSITRLQDDPTIVLAAVKQDPRAVAWVGPLCRNLPEVLQAAGIQTD